MGAILFPIISYVSSLTELAGSRSGLAINRDELHNILADMPGYEGQALWDDDQVIRVRSETYQATVGFVLHRLGVTEEYSDGTGVMVDVYHRYKDDPKELKIFEAVGSRFVEWLPKAIEETEMAGSKTIDPTPYVEDAGAKFGAIGIEIALNLFLSLNRALAVYPWRRVQEQEWEDRVELKELFESASLSTQYGSFLDQRFVDYLANNHGDLDRMHWRKFEGLTAEYFEREGYSVEIGPGRNDDGVDVRVWPKSGDRSIPPLMLVQCKRQKSVVEKVVVKSLWADVQEEGADAGMIVTTSRLSPGAQKTCRARSYPILEADRKRVQEWLQKLRTPGTGIFMGE